VKHPSGTSEAAISAHANARNTYRETFAPGCWYSRKRKSLALGSTSSEAPARASAATASGPSGASSGQRRAARTRPYASIPTPKPKKAASSTKFVKYPRTRISPGT